MSTFASIFRWLQRKRYQYEVTFSLYMMTPTEKFIFNSFIFLFFSMILIAASLYLPQHINFLIHRAVFYWHGDDNGVTDVAAGVAKDMIKNTSTMVADMAKETMGFVEKNAETLRESVNIATSRRVEL